MKKIKKILASLMVVVMVLTAAPLSGFVGMELNLDWLSFDWLDFYTQASAEFIGGTCGENATWALDTETGELVISGTGEMNNYASSGTTLPPWKDYESDVKKISIGEKITYIGNYAFNALTNVSEIIIPDGIKGIGKFAFVNCSNLADITISKNIEYVGESVFTGTAYYGNTENWENGNVLYIDDVLVAGKYTLSDNYEIRQGTRIIADAALSACKYYLTGLVIPESVKYIGAQILVDNIYTYEWTSYAGTKEQWDMISINSNNKQLLDQVLFECNSEKAFFCGTCGDNIAWTLYFNSGELILDGSGEMYDYTGTYGGFSPWYDYKRFVKSIEIKEGITYIGDFAFESCINANEATIPNTVTSIGVNAFDSCFHFYRSNIVIPDSVISIGNECFRDCASLESIVLPSGITTIPSYMFYECNALKSITIPDTVTSIGSSAFRKCTSLTSVTIPENVKDIGVYAFMGCESLENLTIPDNVETIESGAFEDCTSLKTVNLGKGVNNIEDAIIKDCDSLEAIYVSEANPSYSSDENGVLFNKDKTKLIRYPENNSKTSYTVPDGVKTIGSKAFYDCGNLESIILPESVITISTDVFYHCVALESIIIPKNVTSIATDTFSHCESLTGIYVDESNTAYSSDEYGVLFNKNKTQLIRYPEGRISETYEIPKTVTSLATRSFRLCRGPEKITIPDHVTSLGNSVFNYNSGLKHVVIGNGIRSINYEDFNYCWALETMVLPSSVTFIDRFAVIYCDKLTDVYYAGSQEQWEAIDIRPYNELFNKTIHYNCVVLDTVNGTCGNSLTWTFNPKNNELIISGTGKMTDYSSTSLPPWDAFKLQITKLTVQSGVTTIGNDTFVGCANIEEVTLPETLVKIGNSAFRDCTSLKEIAIPDSVTSLGYYSFYGCTGFEEIAVGDGVKTIGNHAFRMCSNLKTVTLPVSLTTVSKNAFNECTSLSTVNYFGTSTQWASVTIAESNDPLISATLVCIGDIHECEYGEWCVTVEPTATAAGEKVHTCIECGEVEAVTIPATGFEPAEGVAIDFATNTISGFNAGETSLDGYTTAVNDNYVWEYESSNGKLGTGSKAILKDGDTVIGEYTILVYGDTTGDSWYDGQDAIIVDCLANGMLTKDDVSEAVYMAADCNHDGVIDQADVALLNEAGTLLANIDQSKPTEVLLETSAEYVEYLDLIDQSPELDVEDDTDIPKVDVETEETPEADTENSTQQDAKIDIFEMIMNFIKSIFEMLLSYIPMPLK